MRVTTRYRDGTAEYRYVDRNDLPDVVVRLWRTPNVSSIHTEDDELELAVAIRHDDTQKVAAMRPAWFN